MLAAIDFDLFPCLANDQGDTHVSRGTPIWNLRGLSANGSPKLAQLLLPMIERLNTEKRHLCVVLPNSRPEGFNSLPIENSLAMTEVHRVTRSEAILSGIKLLERKPAVNAAVLDITPYDSSINIYLAGCQIVTQVFGGDNRLTHLTELFAQRLAEKHNGTLSRRQTLIHARRVLSHLYRPVNERLAALPLPQTEIDGICAAFSANLSRTIEPLSKDLAKIDRIYLAGGGARVLAPWLFPKLQYKVVRATAREHFVSHAAIAHRLGFLLDFLGALSFDEEDCGYDLKDLVPESTIVFWPKTKTRPRPFQDFSGNSPQSG